MSKKKNTKSQPVEEKVQVEAEEQLNEQPTTEASGQPEAQATAEPADDKPSLEQQLENQKNEYLLLMAEFDNFRRRTLREKQDMVKTAAEKAMKDLLPVVDDFERAIAAMDQTADIDSLREGVDLIYNKFIKYLEQQDVKPIESTGKDFDPELHDAITMFPAADESQRGKVVDTTTRGYTIHDKVLRHAKVVVGQ